MHELSHRAAVALLVVCGLLTALLPAAIVHAMPAAAGAGESMPVLVQHWRFMTGLLGAGLLLAAFLPSLRLPAIGAAALSKVAFAAMALLAGPSDTAPLLAAGVELAWAALLLAAGAVFLREARQEARWHGMLPLHPET
jgi:hypothetical protein